MGIIEIWTIVAVVLKLCGVGVFTNWPIIAWPFTWSCLCLELWVVMFYLFLLGICAVLILPYKLCNPLAIKSLLQSARKECEKKHSVLDVLMEEIFEIFEAIQDNNLESARQKIYDSIAVLLRLDKVLQEKQRNEYFKKNDIPFFVEKTKSES